MTLMELRRKDVVCIADGRVIGRASDIEFDASTGQVRALIVPCGSCLSAIWHADKNQMVIPWQQIACIGDDVVLVAPGKC
ncbi:MAG: YlmC/YmxH family sporulation protein [Clostridia bacterium]|nr:YlmC/YmxH family sporulation protein [Clostridia bacterium]